MRRALLMKMIGGVAAGAALLTLSCATTSVATDHDPNVDFSRFRTFAFLGGHIWVNGMADDNNTLVKDRIRNSVVATLNTRGMQQVTSNPDVYVGYLAGARTRTEIETTAPYTGDSVPISASAVGGARCTPTGGRARTTKARWSSTRRREQQEAGLARVRRDRGRQADQRTEDEEGGRQGVQELPAAAEPLTKGSAGGPC